jgi:hypothetical protein
VSGAFIVMGAGAAFSSGFDLKEQTACSVVVFPPPPTLSWRRDRSSISDVRSRQVVEPLQSAAGVNSSDFGGI